jgi:hypothetical protein
MQYAALHIAHKLLSVTGGHRAQDLISIYAFHNIVFEHLMHVTYLFDVRKSLVYSTVREKSLTII